MRVKLNLYKNTVGDGLLRSQVGGSLCPFAMEVYVEIVDEISLHSKETVPFSSPAPDWFIDGDLVNLPITAVASSYVNAEAKTKSLFPRFFYPWGDENITSPVYENPVTHKLVMATLGNNKFYDEDSDTWVPTNELIFPCIHFWTPYALGILANGNFAYHSVDYTLNPNPTRAVYRSREIPTLVSNKMKEFINGTTYPSFPGGNSHSGGGGGTFTLIGDDIPVPGIPTLSAVSAGFITLYAPTLGQLNNLSEYMWSESFDINTFKKLFADPMDVIIGLSIVPVSVPVSGAREVKVGYVSTGVTMNTASSQYVSVNCGTLEIKEFFGSALDYSPYTKFSIFLPFIGSRELKTDDIMGKTIGVTYLVDILSGACTAHIKCGNSVLYQFSGSCAVPIPVASQDFTSIITSAVQLAGAGISSAVSGGGSAAGLIGASANLVTSLKPNVQRSGAVSGNAGMLGVKTPYLIWESPRQSLAKDYNKFEGYPSNLTLKLSTCSGFCKVSSIHIENISATEAEIMEIESVLKEGFII